MTVTIKQITGKPSEVGRGRKNEQWKECGRATQGREASWLQGIARCGLVWAFRKCFQETHLGNWGGDGQRVGMWMELLSFLFQLPSALGGHSKVRSGTFCNIMQWIHYSGLKVVHYEQMEMPGVSRVDGQLSEGCRNRPSSLFTLAFEIYFCFPSL